MTSHAQRQPIPTITTADTWTPAPVAAERTTLQLLAERKAAVDEHRLTPARDELNRRVLLATIESIDAELEEQRQRPKATLDEVCAEYRQSLVAFEAGK